MNLFSIYKVTRIIEVKKNELRIILKPYNELSLSMNPPNIINREIARTR